MLLIFTNMKNILTTSTSQQNEMLNTPLLTVKSEIVSDYKCLDLLNHTITEPTHSNPIDDLISNFKTFILSDCEILDCKQIRERCQVNPNLIPQKLDFVLYKRRYATTEQLVLRHYHHYIEK